MELLIENVDDIIILPSFAAINVNVRNPYHCHVCLFTATKNWEQLRQLFKQKNKAYS